MSNSDIATWKRLAELKGWTVSYTNRGHIRWIPPDGQQIVVTSNPAGRHNNSRNLQRIKAQLKTVGLFDEPGAKLTAAAKPDLHEIIASEGLLLDEQERAESETFAQAVRLLVDLGGSVKITDDGPKSSPAQEGVEMGSKPAIRHYTLEEDDEILRAVGEEYYESRMSGIRVPLDTYNSIAKRINRAPESVQSRVFYLWSKGTIQRRFAQRGRQNGTEPPAAVAEPDDVAPAIATLEAMVFELADNLSEHRSRMAELTDDFTAVTRGMQASIAELRGKVHKLSPTEGNEFVTKEQLAAFTKAVDARLDEIQRSADPLARFRERLKQ